MTPLLLAFLLGARAGSDLPPSESRVVSVYDGDTFTLETGHKVRVRLVNTPELRPLESQAAEARTETERLVLDHVVSLSYGSILEDSWGRILARVQVDGKDLALDL